MKTNDGDKGLKDCAQGQHKQLERPLETGQMSNNTDTETTGKLKKPETSAGKKLDDLQQETKPHRF